MDGAGAALRNTATVFRSGQSDLFADNPQQWRLGLYIDVVNFAINVERYHGLLSLMTLNTAGCPQLIEALVGLLDSIRVGNDEVISVRHFHLRQGLCVHHVLLADQLVKDKKIGCERIDLIIA